MRPRFRISSLFWLVVVVSAFFVGRQSDEIAARLAQLWTRSPVYKLTPQPDGGLLIVSPSPIQRLQFRPANVCIMNLVNGRDYKVLPIRDGSAQLTLWHADGSMGQLNLVSQNKTVSSKGASQATTVNTPGTP